jgi:ABC-type multidrug transport system ATPase subunit/fucose 4-O-acetylase-like acetyltransferase
MNRPTPLDLSTSPDRLHALDAARAGALLLGIVLHATMSFFFVIPAQDVSQSTALAVTFYVIHSFRMSLFFLIAGFFAHLLFHRRGTRGFLKDRAKRVLVPLTAGWLLLAPPTIAAVIWGLKRTFPALAETGDDSSAMAGQGFPLVHLWFLYYLAIFYALALALRTGLVALDKSEKIRTRMDGWAGGALRSYFAPLVLAAPTIAVLYFKTDWAVWFGIPTPDTGLMPQLPALVAYGTPFALGWILHRRLRHLEVFARQWPVNLGLAVALTSTCLAIAGLTPNLASATVIEGGSTMRLAYTAAYVLSIWTWTFGLLGMAVRYFSGASAGRRYFADASYWLYLVHPPIVFGLQVLLMKVPLHWSIKFPAILAVTMAVLLVSYHYLVRPTALGELLNGRRYSRRTSKATDRDANPPLVSAFRPAESEHAARKSDAESVAELVSVTKRYGKTVALDGLSLAVRPGELLAVLGPNGAGKSTAIGLWLGTLQPEEGVAKVLGGSPLEVASRLGVGVMMQEVTLTPMLTASEHVALTTSYYRDPLSVEETLALTGTGELAKRRYGKLSAGQKRQVQFATAVCGRPRLLFLDEPTVGLDIQAREAMWKVIGRLRDDGCSIVLTTHYLEEAEALADRVVVLARGKLIAEGSVDEMRALVTRKRIRCASTVDIREMKSWPGVVDVTREANFVHVTASDAETVVRRLLAADPDLRQLEVQQASLAEAFTEITQEAA